MMFLIPFIEKKISIFFPLFTVMVLTVYSVSFGQTYFNSLGYDQVYTVPNGVFCVRVQLWGAGGGGGDNFNNTDDARGGGGGYVEGLLHVYPGEDLTVVVGSGGAHGSNSYVTTYGGGGVGGYKARNTGNGGGRSAIRRGNIELVTAGAGGGGGEFFSLFRAGGCGGAGGGLAGRDGGETALSLNGNNSRNGKGGTQSSGGFAGSNGSQVNPTSGSFLQGGSGGLENTVINIREGGGGGGGYYGGGGGAAHSYAGAGGGGGSSYVGGLYAVTYNLQGGQGNIPGNSQFEAAGSTMDGYVAGVAVGGLAENNGGNGRVIITPIANVNPPTSIVSNNPLYPNFCPGNSIHLRSQGGTSASGNLVDLWYKGECDNAYTQQWASQPFSEVYNANLSIVDGKLRVVSTNNDPMIVMSGLGSFSTSTYKYINVRYRVLSGVAGNMEVFFLNSHYNYAHAEHFTTVNLVSNGQWQVASLDLTQNSHYLADGSHITGWRFDPATNSGVTIEYDFIQLSASPLVSQGSTLSLNPGDAQYPLPGSTTVFSTSKMEDCALTGCLSTTVVMSGGGTSLAINNESATCYVGAYETVDFYHPTSNRYIASVSATNASLGLTTATVYVDVNPSLIPACGNVSFETAVMQRHWLIQPTNNNGGIVRLPYTSLEFQTLETAAIMSSSTNDLVDFSNQSTIYLSKYSGPNNVNESGIDNCPESGGSGNSTIHTNVGLGMNPVPGISSLFSDFSINSFSEFWLHGSDIATPLAVDLVQLSTICNDNISRISWKTSKELNADYFELERSRDGIIWNLVSRITAAGNSLKENSYLVHDIANGNGYYRLKQVDFDGTVKVYGPIDGSCSNPTEMSVYPNPAKNFFIVDLTSDRDQGEVVIQILDLKGTILYTKSCNLIEGTVQMPINDAQLSDGTYLLYLVGSQDSVSPVRITIQN